MGSGSSCTGCSVRVAPVVDCSGSAATRVSSNSLPSCSSALGFFLKNAMNYPTRGIASRRAARYIILAINSRDAREESMHGDGVCPRRTPDDADVVSAVRARIDVVDLHPPAGQDGLGV